MEKGEKDDKKTELNMVLEMEKRKGANLKIQTELFLPWRNFNRENLKPYIPITWKLKESILEVLREQGLILNQLLPRSENLQKKEMVHLLLKDGEKYLGEVVEENFELRIDGIGMMLRQNGDFFLGECHHGFFHGLGLIIEPQGNWFRGRFEWGFKVEGAYYLAEQKRKFIGELQKGEIPSGRGKYIFDDGRRFEGSFVDGLREGHGVFRWPNGNYYDGGWKNDKQHGISRLFIQEKNKLFITKWEDGQLLD